MSLKGISKITWILLVFPLIVFGEESRNLELSESTNQTQVVLPTQILTLKNNVIVTNFIDNSLLIGTDFGEVLELKLNEKFPRCLLSSLILQVFMRNLMHQKCIVWIGLVRRY